jgi:hypothetical protein
LAISRNTCTYKRGSPEANSKGLCFLSAIIANVCPDYRPIFSFLVISEAFIVERAMGLKLVSEVIEFICGGGVVDDP